MCNMPRGGVTLEGKGDFRVEGRLKREGATLEGTVRVRGGVMCVICRGEG